MGGLLKLLKKESDSALPVLFSGWHLRLIFLAGFGR